MRDEALAWFGMRLGAPLPEPPERRRRGPGRDPVSMLSTVPPPDAVDLGGLVLWLVYRDEDDAESERPVRCRRAWLRGDRGYLSGYCELRREPRLFRLDRIAMMVDPETGEVFETFAYFEALGVHAAAREWLDFLAGLRRGVVVLAALGSADGHLVSDEVEAILRWADRLADFYGVDFDRRTHRAVEQTARLARPSPEEAFTALAEIRERPSESRLILRAARDLVASDDQVTIEEARLMEWLGLGSPR